MKKRKNQKTDEEMMSDVIMLHAFPEVIYQETEHEGLVNLLLFADHLFPRFVNELFKQVNLKSPYDFEDFDVEYMCDSDYMGLEIQINNQQCKRFKRIYVLFQVSNLVIESIKNPSYYLVLEESDRSSTMIYIDEHLSVTELHENVQEEMEMNLIEDHYFKLFK